MAELLNQAEFSNVSDFPIKIGNKRGHGRKTVIFQGHRGHGRKTIIFPGTMCCFGVKPAYNYSSIVATLFIM